MSGTRIKVNVGDAVILRKRRGRGEEEERKRRGRGEEEEMKRRWRAAEEEEEEEEEKGGKRRRRGEEREYEEEEERKKNIGTALFTNGGHQGPVKGPARSLAPARMIAHCNAWGRRSNRHHLLGSKAKPWQKLELCVLEECDRSMLN